MSAPPWDSLEAPALDLRADVVDRLVGFETSLRADLARAAAAPPTWVLADGVTLALATVLTEVEADILADLLADARRLLAEDATRGDRP